jgi:hypothetical protein
MAKFKAGDIVKVKCNCGQDCCLNGNVGVIKSVDHRFGLAILFVPSEGEDRGSFKFSTLTKIGHIDIDETDIPAPLPAL